MNTHPVNLQENYFTSVRDQSLKQEVKSVCCSLWSLSFLISGAPDSSSDVSPDVSDPCDLHIMLFSVSVTSCDYYKHTESHRDGMTTDLMIYYPWWPLGHMVSTAAACHVCCGCAGGCLRLGQLRGFIIIQGVPESRCALAEVSESDVR